MNNKKIIKIKMSGTEPTTLRLPPWRVNRLRHGGWLLRTGIESFYMSHWFGAGIPYLPNTRHEWQSITKTLPLTKPGSLFGLCISNCG